MEEKASKAQIDSGHGKNTSDGLHDSQDSLVFTGTRMVVLVAALSVSVLLIGLDVTLLSTAVPTITTHFHSLDDVSWYGSAFFMTMCTCQPLAGHFFTNCSKRLVYVSYVMILAVGSLLCALAPTSSTLIAGRAIAGIASSGILAGSQIIIAIHVAPELRALSTSLIQGTFIFAEILGPIIGGAFTRDVTWRWCFYINLPLCGLVIVALSLILPGSPTARFDLRRLGRTLLAFDIAGFGLFATFIVTLLLALQWGGTTYSWSSSKIIGLLCGSATTLLLFICWQWHMQDKACVPPKIFTQRTVFAGFWLATFGNGGFIVILYYLQLWFQSVKGASPLSSGLMYLPTVISDVLTAVTSGVILTKVPYYNPLVFFGLTTLTVGASLDTTLTPRSSEGDWIGYQILCGVGFALLVQTPFVGVQRAVSQENMALSINIIGFAQAFSCAIWLAVAQPVFRSVLQAQLARSTLEPELQKAVVDAGATGFRRLVSGQDLNECIKAFSSAITRTFYISIGCFSAAFIASFGLQWPRSPTSSVERQQSEGELEAGSKQARRSPDSPHTL